jgi:hypothetical protein
MKIYNLSITIALLLISSHCLIGQKLPDLIPFREKDLFGYCDSNLNVVIKAQYQRVHPFVEGRAIVVIDNLNGFIDPKGNQVVPCIYKFASAFSKGYALVGKSRQEARYINKKGETDSKKSNIGPAPATIDMGSGIRDRRIGPVKEGRYFYRGQNRTEGYMTVDGDTISSSEYKYPYHSESYSTSDNYDHKFQHFFESRAIVSGVNGQGYIDLDGYLVIDTVYDVAFNFKEGRAKVKLNGKYGFVDTQGNIIGEIKYDQACYFYDGMAQVILNDKCGYINLEGEEIIPLTYDYWQGEQYSSFKNGLVRVRINEKFGILDRNGTIITDVKYDDIMPFSYKRAIVKLKDKMGLIDEDGNEIVPPVYDAYYRLDQFAYVFETSSNDRQYELIDISGKILMSKSKDRATKEKGYTSGIYKVWSSSGHYLIDKYGTKYLK